MTYTAAPGIITRMDTAVENFKRAFDRTGEVGVVPISGDWHGGTGWAKHALHLMARATESPMVFHLGDFGFWPGNNGHTYLRKVHRALVKTNRYLAVTPGNHEDYIQLSRFRRSSELPGVSWNPMFPRIFVLDRGFRWQWNNLTFLSLGGANSACRALRQENRTWWAAEQISWDDVRASQKGGRVDVMFSHDAPMGVDLSSTYRAGSAFPASEVAYMNESREMLRAVTDVVKPRYLFHGHYHKWVRTVSHLQTPNQGEYTMVTQGLDMDYTTHNLGLFHMDSETFERVHTPGVDWKIPYLSSRDNSKPVWDDVEPVQYL